MRRPLLTLAFGVAVLFTWAIGPITTVRAEPHAGQTTGLMRGAGAHGGHDFVNQSIHRLLKHQKDLALSDEQSTKIRAIATDYTKLRIRTKADLKLTEVDIRTLMRTQADLSAVEAALKKSESTRTALRLEGVKALRAAAGVLTPEQREKWQNRRMMRHGAQVS
jgi:Spy/CpxP family protein refolding chaperone